MDSTKANEVQPCNRGCFFAVDRRAWHYVCGKDVNIAARVQGLADVNEVCISATVMEAPGVGDIVKSRSVSRNYENLKGIGQQMEVHRITVTPTQT